MDHDEHFPQCACGTTRNDRNAAPLCEYSTLGTLYLLWGGTAVPERVRFSCVLCGDVFDSITGRAQTRKFAD